MLGLGVSVTALLGPLFSPGTLFSQNEPGVWYDPSDVANLNWRRNLLTWTEQFDNTAWIKAGGGTGSAPTITPNTATAPDGTLTADAIVFALNGGTTNTDISQLSQVVSALSGSSNWSIYLKTSDNSTKQLSLVSPSGVISKITVTGSWQRFEVVGSGGSVARLRLRGDDGVSDSASLHIWGAQLELGSTATEYQRITDVNTEVIQRFPTATLYQDTAGTTPVTTPGQSVALVLDKSKRLAQTQIVTNGDNEVELMSSVYAGTFVGATSGTVARSTDRAATGTASAKFTASTATSVPHYITFGNVPAGVSIRMTGKVYLPTGSFAQIKFVDTSDGSVITPINNSIKDAWVSFSLFRPAKATAWPLAVGNNDPETLLGATFYLDDISLVEIAGNHATQATAASRPTYGVVPSTGRRNLLTYSEQFDNAAWSKFGGGTGVVPAVTQNAAEAPDGTLTADQIVFNSGANTTTADFSLLGQTLTTTAANHTASIWLRTLSGTATLVYRGAANASFSSITVTTTWQQFSTSELALSGTGEKITLGIRQGLGGIGVINSTATILVWGGQLELGTSATAYQRVVSAFDVTDPVGFPSYPLHYLSFDGVDDFLVTPTITPGTDKVQVFAGVRKLSDAAAAALVELGASPFTTDGTFSWLVPHAAAATVAFYSRGTVLQGVASAANYASPLSMVLSGIGDISGDTNRGRVNGVQVINDTDDQGTGNYLANPIYIGRRGGTSLPLNGQLYNLIVRFGANLDTSVISSAEQWVAQKTGVVI